MEAGKAILVFASLIAVGSTFPEPTTRQEGACATIPGFMKNSDRITGGEFAPSNIPWQAQIHMGKNSHFGQGFMEMHYCGATILDAKTILSAAHCFYALEEDMQKYDIPKKFKGKKFINAMDATIRVGFIDQGDSDATKQIGIIEKAIWPSDIGKPYDGLANDIIILKLKSPLKFNSKVQPACLPSEDWEPEYDEKMKERCFVSGWGDQADQASNYPQKVKWVRVPVMPNEVCRETEYGGSITDDMICAGYLGKGIKDACQGDSGGPLVCQDKNGSAIITGVVSFGAKCGGKNHPGVYARVTHFLKWIKDNMEK